MADRSVRVILTAVTSQYQAAMAKATATTKAFGAQAAQSQATQQTATTAMSRFGLTTGNVMGTLVVGALAGSAKAAMDFESSFAGVRKTVEGSEAELQALASGMRNLATEIPVNVNELNRIGEAAGQLGIAKENILGFTETMAMLGVTTNLSSEQAATELARLANITQMPQENFDRLGSTIVALGNASEATESEISEFGLRMAGAGELAGLAEADILAIGTAMSSVGVEAEAGGTAVQKVLLGIDESVHTADDRLATFAKTAGMSAQEFQVAWREDAGAAFASFVEGLGAAGKDATGILKELGLTDQRLIRSFLSLAGSGDTLRESIELGNEAWRENNALTEEAAKRFETTENRIQLAKNQINEAGIEIGSNLLPVIGDMAEAFAGAFPGGSTEMDQMFQAAAGNVEGLSQEFIDGLNPLERYQMELAAARGPLANIPSAFSAAGSAIGGFADDQDTGADATRSATEAITEQANALKDLSAQISGAGDFLNIESAAIGVENAMLNLKDSQAALNELVNAGKKGTREYRRALLGQREAELGVLTSQKDLEASLLSYTEKVKSGEVSQRDAIAAVRAFGREAGMTRSAVDDLIDRIKGYDSSLDGLPREKRTKIEADGLTEAQRALQLWKNQLEQIPRNVTTTVSVQTIGTGTYGNKTLVNHAGGPAGSGATRMGSHLRADEYLTVLQKGEVTFSKAQVKAMAHAPGNVIYVDARGSTLTETQITRAVEKGIDQRNHQDARSGRWQASVAT